MARAPKPEAAPAAEPAPEANAEQPICGIIMPISATTLEHDAQHWSDVLQLVARAIQQAGFEPRPVWEKINVERVSERVIANIFEFPVVIADISDLNPNVMLELGLRLASKKPTVVIMNQGGTIPFDIRDFHAIEYPGDMNMLGMEAFFAELSAALGDKHAAYQASTYKPFLSNVVVDVLSPETRQVGLDQVILDEIQGISSRLANLEYRSRSTNGVLGRALRPSASALSSFFTEPGILSYVVDAVNLDSFLFDLRAFGIEKIMKTNYEGDAKLVSFVMPSKLNSEQQSAVDKGLAQSLLMHKARQVGHVRNALAEFAPSTTDADLKASA